MGRILATSRLSACPVEGLNGKDRQGESDRRRKEGEKAEAETKERQEVMWWTWLLNPKNLILATVTALCVGLLILLLWYRGSYERSVSKAKIAESQVKELSAQVDEYNRDMALMKQHQANMQRIEQDGSSLQTAVDGLKVRILTDDERKVSADITGFINGGVLPHGGSGEVLPAPSKTDAGKPGNDPGPAR